MFKQSTFFYLLTGLLFIACNIQPRQSEKEKGFAEGTFGFDLQYLQKFDSVIVLQSGNDARVIVSAKYQGKVFTSTASGDEGKSFGWINYKAFAAPRDSHMNAYGGENRLWLGPEGGPYSLFFNKGSEMKFQNWKTPAPIDTEAWNIVNKDSVSVQLEKYMELENYAGTEFQLTVDRTVTILKRDEIVSLAATEINDSTQAVGYRTENRITNNGDKEWNEKTGMPCIWMLDMFRPSSSTTVVIPYDSVSGNNVKAITSNYFGEITADRMKTKNGILFFKADGKSRGKLGINPKFATRVAGSYDARSNILTIAFFEIDSKEKYLNQEWTTSKPPFLGDAVNAYNDGPLENGKQLGPFYEIESVSRAAFLKPGEALTHQHTVLHFTGSKRSLDEIARKQFGISLEQIEQALPKSGQ